MIITDKLIGILDGMVSEGVLSSFQYEDKPTANVRLDRNMGDPTAILFQLTDWRLDWSMGTIKEKASINISFLKKEDKLDAKGIEQETIIDSMKEIALDFIRRVKDVKSLRMTDEYVEVKSVFLRSDSNRSGVNLQFDIEELQGECF